MFMDFEPPGASFGLGANLKVFARRNDIGGPLREVRLPPNSKIADLLEKASKALDMDGARKAFYSNGLECMDVDQLDEDEVLQISSGEPFKVFDAPKAQKGVEMIGNFIVQETLGQGGFGSVRKGVHMETGEQAAVKFVPKDSFKQISDLQRVFQEIQSLRQLRHPNVIRIIDVVDHPDSVVFVMEFCSGGELRGYVEKRKFLSEEESRTFFKQIVRAVHYIHSKQIIHRDLKLDNILLDGQKCCKIVDFGLSDYVSTQERTVTDAGTEAYLAPEVWLGSSGKSDPYKLDVWGMGVILYALAHGTLPFSRPDRETCDRLDAHGLDFRDDLSSHFKRIVKAMLTPSPQRRAQVCDLTLDAWVTGNRFAHFDVLDGEESESTGCRGNRRLIAMARRSTFFERASATLGPPASSTQTHQAAPSSAQLRGSVAARSTASPITHASQADLPPPSSRGGPREPRVVKRWSVTPREPPSGERPQPPVSQPTGSASGKALASSRRLVKEHYKSAPGGATALPPVGPTASTVQQVSSRRARPERTSGSDALPHSSPQGSHRARAAG